MNFSPPTHRFVPWDAGGRSHKRLHGDAQSRVSGRDSGIFPLRLPVARVWVMKEDK